MIKGGVALNDDATLFFIIVGAFLLIPVLWIFYIVVIIRNTTVAKNLKFLWILMLVSFHFVAFPIYWYFLMWRNEPQIESEIAKETVIKGGQ